MDIDRKTSLSRDEFVSHYLATRTPVVVSGAMKGWNLNRFEPYALVEHFGREQVQVYDTLFSLQRMCTLKAYVASNMFKPERGPGSTEYVRWYTKLKDVEFVWADHIFAKLRDAWDVPAFVPDSSLLVPFCGPSDKLNPAEARFPYKGLFVSGRGSRTRLHRDPWNSDAVLCQLYGKKKVDIYGPEQTQDVMNGDAFVDMAQIDDARFPNARTTKPRFSFTLMPGEIVYFPGGWFHDVSCATDSVSITWNFLHASKVASFCQHVAAHPSEHELEIVRFFLREWLPAAATAQDIIDFARARYPM